MESSDGINGIATRITVSVSEFLANEFDYVIIGGGTAGLVLAARLTEDANVTVGVLEAGKNRLNDPIVDVPALFSQALHNEDYEWMYRTVPQEGYKGTVLHQTRGKMLGGSSGLNYMAYVRGSDADYDDWATLIGDPSWNSAAMKPYFRKHQLLEPIDSSILDNSTMPFLGENHGTSGPLHTSFNTSVLPIEDDIMQACDEAFGIAAKPTDPWGGDHIGFYNTLATIYRSGKHKGKRSYSARDYLEPNAERPNLKIVCEVTASQIVLDGATATSVSFLHQGKEFSVGARREVLLAAGTFGSAQLLELSGIGDPRVLQQAGIECKVDLASVGENLQDHAMSGLIYELTPGNISLDIIHTPGFIENAIKALHETQGGPLTQGTTCLGFVPYKLTVSDAELQKTVQSIKDAPGASEHHKRQHHLIIDNLESDKSANLQIICLSARVNTTLCGADPSKILAHDDRTPDTPMCVTLFVADQYPASRGSVHITSSDPTAPPAINPAYITHPADVAVTAAGLQGLDKAAQALQARGKFGKRVFPAPNVDLSNVAEAEAAVRDFITPIYHPVGSCAMGQIVDGRLRVMGVTGLRVVDASVFPNHISGNIVGTVYAVAEKAADIIKEDWRGV